ncbi:MAG: tRNA-dihydrouridine synthase family protein, partial [Fidelibacterota bacterium]
MLRIGHLTLDHPVFLAPMAGVTDHPFRVLCRRFGAGLLYTEFVSANGVVRESVKTLDLVRFTPDERPIGIQLFGEEPETIARSAAYLAKRFQPDLVDLNFGCPV